MIECFEKNDKGQGKFKYYGPLGNALAVDVDFQDRAKFDSSQFERNSFIGKLTLVSADTKAFKDEASSLANKLSGNFEKVFNLTKSSIEDTSMIKDGVSKYASTGKMTDGNQAIDKIVSLKSNVKNLMDLLSGLDASDGYESVDTSKITESMLKKLISETFKK